MEKKKKLLRPCPICNEQKGTVLHTQKFALPEKSVLPPVYDVVSCDNCGFCFADTAASQEDYDHYYNQMSKYEDKNTRTGGGFSVFDKVRMDTVADLLLKVMNNKSGSIVDVGCANGGMLTCLSEKGFSNLTGIDISQVCVNNVKALGFSSFFGGIFNVENLHGATFDCLTVQHVMEHIRDLKQAAVNLAKLVNPGGLVYIEVPDASRYPDYYFVPYYYFDCEHINHFNITSLKNLFLHQKMECIYFDEGTVPVSDDKNYPVLRALFRQNDTLNNSTDLEKDVSVMKSIVNYVSLSKTNDGSAEIEKLNSEKKQIIVWGAGMYTLRLLENSPLSKSDILYFIDKDSKKQGNHINGIEIVHPDILTKHPETPVVIASAIYGKAIREEITNIDKHTSRLTILL